MHALGGAGKNVITHLCLLVNGAFYHIITKQFEKTPQVHSHQPAVINLMY